MNKFRQLSVALVALALAAGCASTGDTPGSAAQTLIAPTGPSLAALPGTGAIYAGTVSDAQSLAVTVGAAARPTTQPAGILALGDGMKATVQGSFTGRFELRLELPPAPSADAVPGVLHIRDDGTTVVEAGLYDPVSNEIIVRVDTFSDRFGAWWDPRNWAEEAIQAGQGVWDFAMDWTTGRTDPPPCRRDAPQWSKVRTTELSSVHVCLQGNPADDGTERAELFIKSNRNTLQLITLPGTDKDYVWAENQSELMRAFLPTLGGVDPATNLMLMGGDAMSIGFRRPPADVAVELRSYLTWPIVIVNPLAGLLGGVEGNELEAITMATLSCVNGVGGVDPARLDVVPDGFDSRADFVESMARCAFELAANPSMAIGTFDEMLRGVKVPAADRNVLLGNVRNGLDRIGPTVKRLARVLAIGGVTTNAWDGIFDGLAEGLISLELRGSGPGTRSGACTHVSVARDIGANWLGRSASVGRDATMVELECHKGWAVAEVCPSAEDHVGDCDVALLSSAKGTWTRAGSALSTCTEDLVSQGVPAAVAELFSDYSPCAAPAPRAIAEPDVPDPYGCYNDGGTFELPDQECRLSWKPGRGPGEVGDVDVELVDGSSAAQRFYACNGLGYRKYC